MSGTQFWLLHAALVGGATILMLVTARLFGHLLTPSGTNDDVLACNATVLSQESLHPTPLSEVRTTAYGSADEDLVEK